MLNELGAEGASSCPDPDLRFKLTEPRGPDVISPVGWIGVIGPENEDEEDFLFIGPEFVAFGPICPEFGPDLADPLLC